MPPAKIAKRFELDPKRTHTLAAGIAILGELQKKVGQPLNIARGGLREGAVLTARQRAAA